MRHFLIVFLCLFAALIYAPAQALTPIEVAEHDIAGSPYEIAAGWDFQGHEVLRVNGTRDYVSFRWAVGSPWLETVLHNHVCGNISTFDYGDYKAAMTIDAIRFIVVQACPVFSVHEFTRTRRTWPYVSEREFNALWNRTRSLDATWAALAKGFGFGYQ